MNYVGHDLRTNLQEWKNRLYRANFEQFGNQLKHFFSNIEKNTQLKALIEESINLYDYSEGIEQTYQETFRGKGMVVENQMQHASLCYQFIMYFVAKNETYSIHQFMSGDFPSRKEEAMEDFISPIIYFLHDRLDESNSLIYLFERYKKRTEWFTKNQLFSQYKNAEKGFEQILEDDLRLFLFDQGVEYPLSTPSSSSGRADIIGQIDSNDPLIVEIKIFDRDKGYGKDRIRSGFTQIKKYANDYGKDFGFLVIFNMDEKATLEFQLGEEQKKFPPQITVSNKTYYFIVIDASLQLSASKSANKVIAINSSDL
jgi:hypothetical protein